MPLDEDDDELVVVPPSSHETSAHATSATAVQALEERRQSDMGRGYSAGARSVRVRAHFFGGADADGAGPADALAEGAGVALSLSVTMMSIRSASPVARRASGLKPVIFGLSFSGVPSSLRSVTLPSSAIAMLPLSFAETIASFSSNFTPASFLPSIQMLPSFATVIVCFPSVVLSSFFTNLATSLPSTETVPSSLISIVVLPCTIFIATTLRSGPASGVAGIAADAEGAGAPDALGAGFADVIGFAEFAGLFDPAALFEPEGLALGEVGASSEQAARDIAATAARVAKSFPLFMGRAVTRFRRNENRSDRWGAEERSGAYPRVMVHVPRSVALLVAFVFLAVGCASNPARPGGLPTVSLCAETVAHFEVRDCPREHLLASDVQVHRAETFRVTRDASERVILVELINGHGRAIARADEVSTWSYAYDGDADVPREITEKDRFGKVVGVDRVSDGGRAIASFDAQGAPRMRKASTVVSARRITFDERGRAVRTELLNPRGKPAHDDDGVYGYAYTFDEAGLVTRWTALGRDGKPSVQNRWSVTVELPRDASGALLARRPLDAAGAAVLESDGTAGYTLVYDAYGNVVEQTNVDRDGAPTLDEHGIATATYARDDHGNRTKVRLFDTKRKPTWSNTGIAGFDSTYDDRGNLVRIVNVDTDGRPTLNSIGFSRVDLILDGRDRVVERRWFDVAGAPTTLKSGAASVTYALDDDGNVTEERWFDARGLLRSTTDGWALRKCAYDDADHPSVCDTFDPANRPATVKDGGYSHVENSYDAHGDVVEIRFGAPSASSPPRVHGGTKRVIGRDELGAFASDAYYDESGALSPKGVDGFARAEFVNDESGDTSKATYYGADGHVAMVVTTTRDEHGWVVADERSGPDAATSGPARRTFARDVRGLVVGVRYAGVDGKPVLDAQGIAGADKTLDARGRVVRERYVGLDGKPSDVKGIAGVETRFDDAGREVEQTWIGADGAPRVTATGWATRRTTYDRHGFVVERRYLDASGSLVLTSSGFAVERMERTRLGAMLSYRVFDADDRPTRLQGKKYFGWRAEFDDRGNTVKNVFLDENRRRMPGFLTPVFTFDGRDAVVEQRFVDIDDHPATNVEGISILRFQNDDRGRRRVTRFYDVAGQPTAAKTGVAEIHYAYDDATGELVEETQFGVDGKPVDNAEGWSVRRNVRGDGGEKSVKYFAVSGAEVTPKRPESPPEE